MVLKLKLIILALVFGVAPLLQAQVERVLPRKGSSSLEGTSFVVGFMANEILQAGGDPRVQIFIASQYDAAVTINSPISGTRSVFVPAGMVHIETMHPQHVVNASEQSLQRAVFVESDVPVVVYALNTITQSSDSYTAIPIKHCGKLYYTVNRPTDWYRANKDPLSRIPRVGEFMVMATENNTLVDIVTTTATKGGVPARTPSRVWLNKGDCYLVQALPTRFGGDDLTGSSVTSNIPVAVISGHQRASMPLDSLSSKDHLVEQLPPVNLWGKTYATTPFISSTRPDVLRIMASNLDQDVVLITKNGSKTFRLTNPGDWIDTALLEPASWSSTKPFFLTQFMTSAIGANNYTDPAMVVVPPIEQFVNSALFQFPKLEVNSSVSGQEFFYFLNVVADSNALSSLRVDTGLVSRMAPQINTQTIPGTPLHWATIQMQPGVFLMRADTGTFSAVMYGTTLVDSYANMVGVSYVPLITQDITPPIFSFLLDCGVVSGSVTDVSADSARIDEIRVVTARTYNYRWQMSGPQDVVGTVEFDADIRDLWKDAQLVVHAYDYNGNGREWLYYYDAPNVDVPKESVISLVGETQVCTTTVLRNRDTTSVHIVRLSVTGDPRIKLMAGQTTDTVLAAGDSLIVTLCITPTKDTSAVRGFLVIEYPCKLLRMMTVRSTTVASILSGLIDFGSVRIGDTVCSRVPIVNDGLVDITVSVLMIAKVARDLNVDISLLGLPRLLRPRDTLWISVCYTPSSEGLIARSDTVIASHFLTALASYSGRGVRPQISPVSVNWGRRRIGSVNDTVMTLRNNGSGWCTVKIVDSTIQDSTFTVGDIVGAPALLVAGQQMNVRLHFRPQIRGLTELSVPLIIDWRGHEPVSIVMKGTGTMPDVTVTNIDLVSAMISTRLDSIVSLVRSGLNGGNEDLTVSEVRVYGADQADFQLPASILGLRSLGASDSVRDNVSFTPRRVGRHEVRIEIDHDAARSGMQATSVFTIIGRGVNLIEAKPAMKLSLDAVVDACSDVPVVVTIVNHGNGIMKVDTLMMRSLGLDRSILPNGQPFSIEADGLEEISVPVVFDRNSDPRVDVRLVDSAGATLFASATTKVRMPSAEVTVVMGNGFPYQNGPTTLHVAAILEPRQEKFTTPVLSIDVPQVRFAMLPMANHTARLTNSQGTMELLPVAVEQTSESIVVTALKPVKGAWALILDLPGNLLWLNPEAFDVLANSSSTNCYDSAFSKPTSITVEPCAGNERVVRLGALPTLKARVMGLPVSEWLDVELEASMEVEVSAYLESATGQRFTLSEQFSLQKGLHRCIFSCNGWSSGLYRLVFVHRVGATDVLIIVIK